MIRWATPSRSADGLHVAATSDRFAIFAQSNGFLLRDKSTGYEAAFSIIADAKAFAEDCVVGNEPQALAVCKLADATLGVPPEAAERAVEFQRRYVLLCRRHGVSQSNVVPTIELYPTFAASHPDFMREREALLAEFSDGRQSQMWDRKVAFTKWQLTEA